MKKVAHETPIIEGRQYEYVGTWPAACRGHIYRVAALATLVPVYQEVAVVEAITGPDTGRWFVCSCQNFVARYQLLPLPGPEPVEERPPDPPPEEKVIDMTIKGSGV